MIKVACLTPTYGRHKNVENVLYMFLKQTYKHAHLFIFNNHPLPLQLKEPYLNVTLINRSTNELSKPFSNLGEIYNCAVHFIPDDFELITFMDDDDFYSNNHIEEGVKGYQRALKQKKIAYKPEKSYYWNIGDDPVLTSNNFEPSVFVKLSFIKEVGFHPTTTDQHLKWYDQLVRENKILIDPDGIPTLYYTWNNNVFKTSGAGKSFGMWSFNAFRSLSNDNGDGILEPIPILDIK